MGMKQFMGKYPTLSSMPLPYPTLPAGIGLFMGKYPTLSSMSLPYPTLPAGIRRFMGKYPTLSPLGPTLPYPRHGDSSCPWRQFWPPAGIRRFVGREDTQSPLPPYAWRQFMPMETVHRPVTGMKRFMGKCPTLSPLPLNHGDSFTGRSTFIHVIPYTFVCNRIPSNILQYTQFHGNQMSCPPIQVHPRLFPFHSYPFHGNFSIFPHLPFSLVFFPFSSLFFQHVTSNSIESITFHGNLFVHSFNQSSPSSSSFFSF